MMPTDSDENSYFPSIDSIADELASPRSKDLSLNSTSERNDPNTSAKETVICSKLSGGGRMTTHSRYPALNSSAARALNSAVGLAETEKPDIRLWLLQNQLSALREEVQTFQSTLKTTVQDFVEEWKQESDNLTTKASRNESAWNTQFSHLTRHIQQQIQDVKKYCRDDLVKKQILVLERNIIGKVTNEHLLPVQEQYRELETAIQYQSNELRDAIDKQQVVMTSLEKSVNVRKIIIEGLERQIQTFGNELTGLQKEWKSASSSLDDTSEKLVDTVQTLSEQCRDEKQIFLNKIEQLENALFEWEKTMNMRYEEHECLFRQVQDQDMIIKELRSQLDSAVDERDQAKWKLDESLEDQRKQLESLKNIVSDQADTLQTAQQELTTTKQELHQYQSDKEREQSLLEQELDERQEAFDELQRTVKVQQSELIAMRAEVAASKVERDEVRKEIAKNMEMQNTLFDYLMKQVQSQSHEIKETNTTLSGLQRHCDSVVSKLERKITEQEAVADNIITRIREQATESLTAKEEREGLRTLIKTNMETCMNKDKELNDCLLQHCKDRDASFLQLDEAHTKLLGIMSVRETLINSFLQHIQKHSTDISEIKETAKLNKEEIKDTLKNSVQNLQDEIQTSNGKIASLDKKIDFETKALSQELQNLQGIVQAETIERTQANLQVQTHFEAHKVELINLQQKLDRKVEDVDKIETDISSLRKDILSVNALNSETAGNLSREIESRDIQFVQLVDQVQHQAQQLEEAIDQQGGHRKEIEAKMDVRHVMFQHLVRQLQQQLDEFNKFKVKTDSSQAEIGERMMCSSDRIEQIANDLNERYEEVDNKLEHGLFSIKKQLTNIEETRLEDKNRFFDSRKELESTLALRQALFDQLVRQVQTHIADFNKSKEDQIDVRRLVDLAVNDTKDGRIDNLNEQIKDLSEYIHSEKEERLQSHSELVEMVEQESSAIRLELNASLENRIALQNSEFAEKLQDFVNQEEMHRQGEIYSKKFEQHGVSLKELLNQIQDHDSKLQRADSDLVEVQRTAERTKAELENALASHELNLKDGLKLLQDCNDSLAAVSVDINLDRENMSMMKLLQENLMHEIEEQVNKLKQQLNSHHSDLKMIKNLVDQHSEDIRKASSDLSEARVENEGGHRDLRDRFEELFTSYNVFSRQLHVTSEDVAHMNVLISQFKDDLQSRQEETPDALKEYIARTISQYNQDILRQVEKNRFEFDTFSRDIDALVDNHSFKIDNIFKQMEEARADIGALKEGSGQRSKENCICLDVGTETGRGEATASESSQNCDSTHQYQNLMKRIEMSKKAIRELQLDININNGSASSHTSREGDSYDIGSRNDDESKPHQMTASEYNILRSQVIVAGATSKDILKKVEALESRLLLTESQGRNNFLSESDEKSLIETRDDQCQKDDLAQHLSELYSIRTEIMSAMKSRDEQIMTLELRLDEQNKREGNEKELLAEKRIHELEQRIHDLAHELRVARESFESELDQKKSSLKKVEKKLETASEKLKETKGEHRGLRVTLGGMQDQHEQFRSSFQNLA